MKLIRKTLISLLTVFMLFTCVGYGNLGIAEENDETLTSEENNDNINYEDEGDNVIETINENIEDEEIFVVEENEEDIDKEIEIALNGANVGAPFPIPKEYVEKVTNISNTFISAFGKKGTEYFTKMTSGISGIFSLSMDILQKVGAFGMTQEEKDREALNNRLNAIDSKLDQIDGKVDSLQETLNEAIKAIDEQLQTISVKLDKENITAVANIAADLKNEMNNYDAALTYQIHTWYNNDNIEDYLTTSRLYVVSVPATPQKDAKDVRIKVPKDVMIDEIDNYTIEHLDDGDDGWVVDKKEEIVEKIFAQIFDNMLDDEDGSGDLNDWIKGYDPSYVDWSSYSKKDEIRKVFADAGLLSLCIRAAKNIASASTSGATTYVSGLINDFTKYCNYLSEAEGRYTSPLQSQFNIYAALNAFQGDLKLQLTYDTKDEDGKDITKTIDTNLADLAMKNYIAELGDIGTFVGIMAKASGNYGEDSDMVKLIYIPWAAAEDSLIKAYNDFYHMDGEDDGAVPIDNYCYITKSILDYKTGTLSSVIDMKFYAWENGFGTDIKSFRDTYMREDWTYSIDNSLMVSNTNLSLINAYYSKIGGGDNFTDYLNNRKVNIEEEIPTTIVTRFIGGRDFSGDDKVSMFIKNCHNNPDKFKGKDYLKGDVTTVTSSSSHFKIRRKAVADVYDLSTNTATNSKRLGAVASFYEKYTFKDDLVLFWDAEYNNPQTVEERIALAKKEEGFYYKDRWDKRGDPEERYTSSVTYNRTFGTIVSRPLGSDVDYYDTVTTVNPSNQLRFDLFNLDSISSVLSKDEIEALKVYSNRIDKAESKLNEIAVKNGIDYEVYLDETATDNLNFNTYDEIYNYLVSDGFVNSIISDMKTYSDMLKTFVKNNSELYSLDYSDGEITEITKKSIEVLLDCVVLDKYSTSNRKDLKNIYDMSTGKLYVWNVNKKKYVEYKASDDKIIKTDKITSAEIESGQKTPIMLEGDYPTSKSVISMRYIPKMTLSFEIKDNNGKKNYEVHPVFTFVPIIVWNDNSNAERSFEIPESVLSIIDIENNKGIKVALPVLQANEKDNKAQVVQYVDLAQVDNHILDGTYKISGSGLNKYVLLTLKENGPVFVMNTYHKSNHDYSAPSTGI
ncbi:MAG: hypothetical protein Q4E33_00550 [Erysipelotrichaceae bacterium]|nr:hypothetical protein [Erysipelotrichaceae bacterium]